MRNDHLKTCSSCGETVNLNAAFCTNCGNRFAEDAKRKQCTSCGEEAELNAAFCAQCGSSFGEKNIQSTGVGATVEAQLLKLANEFLSVRGVGPGRFEFSSQTGAGSPVQKVKIKYDAVVRLEPEKRQLVFWEKMVESGAGMDAGFFSEKKVQKGIEVGKKVHGHLLFGGKYGFEYGKLREVVKAIAVKQGWKFKTAIFKP